MESLMRTMRSLPHHGEGRADNRTVNVIAVTDQLHAALRIVECGADDTRVTVCERRHGGVAARWVTWKIVLLLSWQPARCHIICCCMADANHDFIGNLFDNSVSQAYRGQGYETDFPPLAALHARKNSAFGATRCSPLSHCARLFDRIDERSFHVDAGDHFCFGCL